jgi:hypothetical protein
MARRGVVRCAALAICLVACGPAGKQSSEGPVEPPPPPPPPPPPVGFVFGTQGPWPVANAIYGAKDGIKELPVIGVTTDEAQNRWVATNAALYLLEPGATTFKRFDERDGLHMGSNQAHYCNDRPIPVGQRCTSVESWGTAAPPGIEVIVGGGKGEVFVGYHAIHLDGNDCGNNGNGEDWCDPMRHSGKIDRVRVGGDGTLTVDRFDLVANNHGGTATSSGSSSTTSSTRTPSTPGASTA